MSWIQQKVHRLRVDAHAVWLAARDPRTPLIAKLIGLLVAGYALSPIDLIPDFVPVLGLLDDIIILPIGIWFCTLFIPDPLWEEHLAKAEAETHRPVSLGGAIGVAAIWLGVAAVLALYLYSWRYW